MNTNPEAKRILCYGDSYTWGYIPGTNHLRMKANERWTGILQNLLGESYEIIEEGLNSRTLISEDSRKGKEGRNGSSYLIPCLETHDPIDLVILMLGTNESKTSYGKNAKEISKIMENNFVKIILGRKSQFRETFPKLLLISPSFVDENKDYSKEKYKGAKQKLLELSLEYKKIANKYNCFFINSGEFLEIGFDGVHIDSDNAKKLAEKVYETLKKNNF